MRLRLRVVLAALFLSACASQQGKSINPFRFNAARGEVGTTYHYLKTNLDGSHPEHISVYVAGPDRIESFKFHPGEEPAGLVLATMRWDIGSVQRLESWSVYGDGHRTLVATLDYRPEAQAVDVAFPSLNRPTERIAIGRLPYYVFNFDLSDLNFAFRHRKAPTAPLVIGLADPTFAEDGPLFAYRGEVRLEYLGEELREGRRCRKYRIDGPGLARGGGILWVDKAGSYFRDAEIQTANNPEWQSFKFRLLRTERLERAGWEAFMRAQF